MKKEMASILFMSLLLMFIVTLTAMTLHFAMDMRIWAFEIILLTTFVMAASFFFGKMMK